MSTAVVSACEKRWKPAPKRPVLGDFVEPAFGVLDLLARREIHRRVEGDVDHVLADADQGAAHGEVGDRARIVDRH